MLNMQFSNSGGNLTRIFKQKANERKIFTNILTEIYCGRGHWKYERPFVNKEFHMTSTASTDVFPLRF